MPGGRGLGGLQVGVVGGERASERLGLRGECGAEVAERRRVARHALGNDQTQGHAERLAARTAGAEPAGGARADACGQLLLAVLEGIAHRRIPRELVGRNRIELEQAPQQLGAALLVEPATLDQRDRMREVGTRQGIGKCRARGCLGTVARADELVRRTSRQAPTHSEMTISHTRRVALAQGSTGQTSIHVEFQRGSYGGARSRRTGLGAHAGVSSL